jgi:hypothetical protein
VELSGVFIFVTKLFVRRIANILLLSYKLMHGVVEFMGLYAENGKLV